MSARHEYMDKFATVDIDAVWLARGLRQDAQNRINQHKNEGGRYGEKRQTVVPQAQRGCP